MKQVWLNVIAKILKMNKLLTASKTKPTKLKMDIFLSYTARQSLLGDGNWDSDFQTTQIGRSYTIQIPGKPTPNWFKYQVLIELNKSLNYIIYIHDKDFYIANENPYGLKMPLIKLNPSTDPIPYYYQLGLTSHEELNVPEDPCETDLGYNFQVFWACYKTIVFF